MRRRDVALQPEPLAAQLREAYMVYVIDAALFPAGFLGALAIADSPYHVVLLTPLSFRLISELYRGI